MPKYVILRHDPGPVHARPLHWDLMFEVAGTLRTWALAEEPSPGRPIAAEALPDHRLEYLHHEGPVSGNRGSVSRWDAGEFEWLARSEDGWTVSLRGHRWRGTARLSRLTGGDHRWEVTFEPGTEGS